MSTAPRRPPRHRAWPRLLVLLLALLVPGAHVQAQAAPGPALAAGAAEHEHEVPGPAAWPSVHAAPRGDPPRRPAPLPGPAPGRPAARPCPAPQRPPHAVPLLRTVVLRC